MRSCTRNQQKNASCDTRVDKPHEYRYNVFLLYKDTMMHTMELKEKYTVAEATTLLGFTSRSTINKRTKGQGGDAISYQFDDSGTKVISAIELQRVYPEKFSEAMARIKNTENTTYPDTQKIQQNTTKNTENTQGIQVKIDALEQKILHLNELRELEQKSRIKEEEAHAETKAEKRRLLEILENQTRLLTHIQEENAAKPKPKKRFLGKLFS